MNDDVSTAGSNEPMSEDTAAEEPEEPMVESSPEAADEGDDDGGDTRMLGDIEIPSTGRMLVGIGGAAMALSTLLSWIEVGGDSFPNIAGVGVSSFGIGFVVFLAGLSLLLGRLSVGATMGIALGAFGSTLIFISLIGIDDGLLAVGAWVGLAGSAVAVLGALMMLADSDDRPPLDFRPVSAALGAALAVVASFWLDWVLNASALIGRERGRDQDAFYGLDADVLFGIPILILGGIVLVLVIELMSFPPAAAEKRRQAIYLMAQIAGIAITVIAGTNIVGLMMLGVFAYGSGPLVAVVGGVLITRSIRTINPR